ncbi:putative SERF-like protein [Zopfochytrium polystomum]|nr:putative SERF-like protein [Zopfochytrium polystomum]
MTRGNQRDLARKKAEKKAAEMNKGRKDNMTPAQRKEYDTAQLNAKIAAKAAASGGGSESGSSSASNSKK